MLWQIIALVHAGVSVRIGDVSAPAIGEVHGWLGHTWKYHSDGQYQLYAHTGFGDVSLVTK